MAVQDDLEPQANGVWGQVEDLIKRSGLEWTFLRASGFATNTLGWADQIRVEGVVRWPYGDAARSLIHERDIAAVAVRALTEDRHTGATYVLTGPEAVTQAEQVRIIGEVVGLPVHWEELAPEVARQQLVAAMGDLAFADSSLEYWARLRTEPEPVTRTVEEVTGTPARTFAEWARDHADDFRRLATAEVAEMYVSSFRTGNLGAAFGLLSPDMVRAAPMEGAGEPAELRGLDAIMENSQRLNADYEIHGVDVDDPLVNQDRFAVRFAFDETPSPPASAERPRRCAYTPSPTAGSPARRSTTMRRHTACLRRMPVPAPSSATSIRLGVVVRLVVAQRGVHPERLEKPPCPAVDVVGEHLAAQ